jgi:hypothetical protein
MLPGVHWCFRKTKCQCVDWHPSVHRNNHFLEPRRLFFLKSVNNTKHLVDLLWRDYISIVHMQYKYKWLREFPQAGWQADRQTKVGIGRQAGRQADRQTGKQASRQTAMQRQTDSNAGRQVIRDAEKEGKAGKEGVRGVPMCECSARVLRMTSSGRGDVTSCSFAATLSSSHRNKLKGTVSHTMTLSVIYLASITALSLPTCIYLCGLNTIFLSK